ncbi:heme biosynthesis HemY N-terminal domain-containing protein [Roseibium porphyridii]|uniref:Heme biosynthesis HemY N-terminal domain-containing protein n=1 Tax=Roseibium porphyridii TaxID=2866279 RepID=A0ABY8F4W4_9HYPH|nr:heme biosynthesis HemY N-terminal domain-containing protein [Roseibium sp. KMA01]WFE90535.1 heme biosynthesis HemY N-terminal domain-containing protein [Roseibium sp. KMA01]
MIRVLGFFIIVFLVALGFAWLADVPGMVSIQWTSPDPERVPIVWQQTPAVAAVVVGVLLAVFLLAVWIIRVILKSPVIASRFFQRRRKDKGYSALSQGLIALGTGNAKLARRFGVDADKLLSEEPATKLLLAQTAQLAGKDDEARLRFEAMLDDPSTKALGLHGLFVEAERHREPIAARHYAEEAAKTSPGLEWAGKAVLGYQAVAHHWDEALKTLERNYAAKLMDKKTYRRQRAVILTALAQKLEDGEPERAYSLAKEAHGLALDLVPASVLTSRLATRRGDIRKASKVLEATWRLFPHPDLAETYAHVRTGDSAVDRLKRVKALSAQRANTPEGAMAIAKAAMEAREFEEARKQLKKALQSEPTRKAFLAMAELEETESGDKGRMRDWLARAVNAPMDKAWVADGIVSADWQAVSPVTGRLDAFEWTTTGNFGEEAGDVLEDSLFEAPALAPAASMADSEPVSPPVEIVSETAAVDLEAEPVSKDSQFAGASTQADNSAEATADVSSGEKAKAGKQGYEGTTDDVKYSPALKDLPEATSSAAAPAPSASKSEEPKAPEKSDDKAGAGAEDDNKKVVAVDADATEEPEKPKADAAEPDLDKEDLNRPIEFPLSRMPDDPGPDDDDDDKKAAKTTRPRFFN